MRLIEGSYLPSNRNSPKSEQIENAPLDYLMLTFDTNLQLQFFKFSYQILIIYT